MMNDQIQTKDNCGASVTRGAGAVEAIGVQGTYTAQCFDAQGNLKWEDVIQNVVTTAGKNLLLDTILAGSSFTATVVMGLKGTGTAVAADTQASHASWLEQGLANAPTYTGSRKTPAFSAASAGSKATSAAVSFAITSSGTVFGCFININGSATVDNTTGTLFSAGDFTGGSKAVTNGDTLNVTYTLTA